MTTPSEVFERLSHGISNGNWAELSALYAEDTVVELPQRAARIVGRQAVHDRFTGPLSTAIRLQAQHTVVHETTDPEVVVAEYDYHGEALTTGKTFDAANIQMLRIRDGLIVHSRDYHDYLRMGTAQGVTPQATTRELTPIPPRPVSAAIPDSARDVFERLIYGVSDGKWDELPELYAEETHVTHPFMPGAATLKTRDDLRAHFTAGMATGLTVEARDLVAYEGKDPEVVIGEFDYQGTTADGRPLRASNIFSMRVRDGLIVESRDYGDVITLAAATGRLDELVARL